MRLPPTHRSFARYILASVLSLCLCGCIGLLPSPFRPSPGPQKAPQPYDLAEAFDVVCRNYRLGPEDRVGYRTANRLEHSGWIFQARHTRQDPDYVSR